MEPPPLLFPQSSNRNSSGGNSHGSSSSDSGNNNINGNDPSNHSNNANNNPSGPVLKPIQTMTIFDNQLDHVLQNLCNYNIDDADDVLNRLFHDNMVTLFCQFCNTPASELGFWQIMRDDGSFTPIIRNVQMSLSNVLYYASALEAAASNNPPWDDATQWTSQDFDKWVRNDKDAFLSSGNATVSNNAFAFAAPAGGAAAPTAGNKTDQNALDMFNKRPPNQTVYEALTNNANYYSWLVTFKRQATFDHLDCVLDKNNKPTSCRVGPDWDLWDLQVNFLAIILKKTLQTK